MKLRLMAVAMAVAVQIDEADQGRLVESNSLPCGDFVQRVINVRQMVRGNVADERADDFVITHTAMQPAEKQNKLCADGKDSSENAVPVCRNQNPWTAAALPPLFFRPRFVGRFRSLNCGAGHSCRKSGSELPHSKRKTQRKAPGRAARVEPRPEPREEKKPPVLREALLRTLRSSEGMPSVRPRRLESTPNRPERPCNAAIWRWNAVLVKASWFFCAWPASAIPFWRASSSVSSPKPAELRVRARRFCADCWSASKALARAPCDCPVTAALSAGLRPGLFRML